MRIRTISYERCDCPTLLLSAFSAACWREYAALTELGLVAGLSRQRNPGCSRIVRRAIRATKLRNADASLCRFAQRARVNRAIKLRPLPLRAEEALLDGALLGRADLIAGRSQIADTFETHVDHAGTGNGAFEGDLLRPRHHGKPALGMIEQVLRGHHDREVLDGACPDQNEPSGPQFALVLACRHEDELGAAQCERARHFRHVHFAAHREPDLAVHGVEYREFLARHPLEFPGGAAG